MSLSSRRAWIEISDEVGRPTNASKSLSSRRAWIEISPVTLSTSSSVSRSPHGERGLKYVRTQAIPRLPPESLSSRRAWIEITV